MAAEESLGSPRRAAIDEATIDRGLYSRVVLSRGCGIGSPDRLPRVVVALSALRSEYIRDSDSRALLSRVLSMPLRAAGKS